MSLIIIEFWIDILFQIIKLFIFNIFWFKLKKFKFSKFIFQFHQINFIYIWISFELDHIESKNILNYLKIQNIWNYYWKNKYYLDEIIFDNNNICNDNNILFLKKYEFWNDNNGWNDCWLYERYYIKEIKAWNIWFNWFYNNKNLFI